MTAITNSVSKIFVLFLLYFDSISLELIRLEIIKSKIIATNIIRIILPIVVM